MSSFVDIQFYSVPPTCLLIQEAQLKFTDVIFGGIIFLEIYYSEIDMILEKNSSNIMSEYTTRSV